LIIFGCFPRLLTDNIKTSVAPVARLVGEDVAEGAPIGGGVRR
jgi:hypothetical protein